MRRRSALIPCTPCRSRAALFAFLAGSLTTSAAQATWSIIMVDTASHEIAVGGATCLTGINLLADLPVVIVDQAAAVAQSLVDVNAVNRVRIYERFLVGTRPPDILFLLSSLDPQHQQRQYGFATTRGDALTFTGLGAGAYAGGLTGEDGTLVYAIQGNVLTGQPVIDAAEAAVRTTPGDIPEKLMAAMQAARAMGGDGRCSCFRPGEPTGCGSPPGTPFEKSAHVGFMIVARPGDGSGVCAPDPGCANGDYYLSLNVANAALLDPDPVVQLRALFDPWRAALVGKPDAVRSTIVILPASFPADGNGRALMTIHVNDWQGQPVKGELLVVEIDHAPGSALSTTISEPVQIASNIFEASLTGSNNVGVDVFDVRVRGDGGTIALLPRPRLISAASADLNQDGDVDYADFEKVRACMAGPGVVVDTIPLSPCFPLSGVIDLHDVAAVGRQFTGPPCVELQFLQHPASASVRCSQPVTLGVAIEADPPAMLQWFRDNMPISGATGSTYFIPAMTTADFAAYHVEASNTCGTVASRAAQLTASRPCP